MVFTFDGQDLETFIDAYVRKVEAALSPSAPDLCGELQYYYKGEHVEHLEDLKVIYMCASPTIRVKEDE
jgi:hypothetical protein